MQALKNSPLKKVADYAGAEDWQHDPYGTAMMLFFDVAAVLDAADVAGDITPGPFAEWGYNRGACTVPDLDSLAAGDNPDSYGQRFLAGGILDGEITTDELLYVGRVLHRYVAILTAHGRDY